MIPTSRNPVERNPERASLVRLNRILSQVLHLGGALHILDRSCDRLKVLSVCPAEACFYLNSGDVGAACIGDSTDEVDCTSGRSRLDLQLAKLDLAAGGLDGDLCCVGGGPLMGSCRHVEEDSRQNCGCGN